MPQRAVLLVNLGSPDSPSVPDVRRYLREFLMDGRVLDTPWPVRFGVVHFAILPKRPVESARAYSKIWTRTVRRSWSPAGSHGHSCKSASQSRSSSRCGIRSVDRYAVQKLAAQGVTEIFLIPLFPTTRCRVSRRGRPRAEAASRLAPNMTAAGPTAVLRRSGLHRCAGGHCARASRGWLRSSALQLPRDS